MLSPWVICAKPPGVMLQQLTSLDPLGLPGFLEIHEFHLVGRPS